MGLFRSEKMGYHALLISRENAWSTLHELGELESLHFLDQNPEVPAMLKPYYPQVKRCDDLLQKIQYIKEQLCSFDFHPSEIPSVDDFLVKIKEFLNSRGKAPYSYIMDLEAEIETDCEVLRKQVDQYDEIKNNHERLVEKLEVYLKAKILLENTSFFS